MALLQAEFGEVRLAEEASWEAVVLIPKGGVDYLSIDLVEVVWKVMLVILNRCLISSITFKYILHGFRAGCGTGAATIEAKVFLLLASMKKEVMYVIFLYLYKAYSALEREIFLYIL